MFQEITEITINNLNLKLAPLTVLSGRNGTGKTTVLSTIKEAHDSFVYLKPERRVETTHQILFCMRGGIILENPEVFLHNSMQTLIGKLLAQTVASGHQVIVETHSDHILDGIRIAVMEGLLKPEQTAFHYFFYDKEEEKIKITTPQINTEGRFNQWPEGFFDEAVKNLAALSSRRR